MPYTPDQIWEIGEMHAEWLERESALTRRLFAHLFESARAREMMQHGLSRRLGGFDSLVKVEGGLTAPIGLRRPLIQSQLRQSKPVIGVL